MFRKAFIFILLILLSACGVSPRTNFYLLSSERNTLSNVSGNVAIGVWKVNLPDLIDRPEMVTRTGPYTIDMADFHRWAGGLGSNVTLLIANELAYNLETAYVDVSPWSSYRNFDYQIKVHIRQFDGELGGESSLVGTFLILNGKGDKQILEESFSFKENVNDKNYSQLASAMSKLVIRLSDKISNAISKQISKK